MEELKNVITPFYERLRRPFIGAYAIAWFFINWKLWTALLFYGETVDSIDKIKYMKSLICHHNLWFNPLCYALGFLLITPVLDLGVFAWQDWFRTFKKRVKFHFAKITPVEPETHRRLIEEKDAVEKEYTEIAKTVQQYKDENRQLHDSNKIFRRSNLDVNEKFFHGDWILNNSASTEIRLRITAGNRVFLIKQLQGDEVQKHELYQGLWWQNNGRFIQLLLKKEQFSEHTRQWIDDNLKDQSLNVFAQLFITEKVCVQFEIEKITNNEIVAFFFPAGPTLVLKRIIPDEAIPKLWTNDHEGEFNIIR